MGAAAAMHAWQPAAGGGLWHRCGTWCLRLILPPPAGFALYSLLPDPSPHPPAGMAAAQANQVCPGGSCADTWALPELAEAIVFGGGAILPYLLYFRAAPVAIAVAVSVSGTAACTLAATAACCHSFLLPAVRCAAACRRCQVPMHLPLLLLLLAAPSMPGAASVAPGLTMMCAHKGWPSLPALVLTRLPSHLPTLQHLAHWIDTPRRGWCVSTLRCIWFYLTIVLPYSGEASSWARLTAPLRGDGGWLLTVGGQEIGQPGLRGVRTCMRPSVATPLPPSKFIKIASWNSYFEQSATLWRGHAACQA